MILCNDYATKVRTMQLKYKKYKQETSATVREAVDADEVQSNRMITLTLLAVLLLFFKKVNIPHSFLFWSQTQKFLNIGNTY